MSASGTFATPRHVGFVVAIPVQSGHIAAAWPSGGAICPRRRQKAIRSEQSLGGERGQLFGRHRPTGYCSQKTSLKFEIGSSPVTHRVRWQRHSSTVFHSMPDIVRNSILISFSQPQHRRLDLSQLCERERALKRGMGETMIEAEELKHERAEKRSFLSQLG